MLVRVTKFVETPGYRHRLQRTIEMPCPPQAGWILDGLTLTPAVSLVVEKVVWNSVRELVEVVCKPGELRDPEVEPDVRLRAAYGPEWTYDGVAKA